MILDRIFGRFSVWRDARAGVWEKWGCQIDNFLVIEERWFGPFGAPYNERVKMLANADGAALSILRLWISTGATSMPTLDDLAKPTLECFGVPRKIEDHREDKMLNG